MKNISFNGAIKSSIERFKIEIIKGEIVLTKDDHYKSFSENLQRELNNLLESTEYTAKVRDIRLSKDVGRIIECCFFKKKEKYFNKEFKVEIKCTETEKKPSVRYSIIGIKPIQRRFYIATDILKCDNKEPSVDDDLYSDLSVANLFEHTYNERKKKEVKPFIEKKVRLKRFNGKDDLILVQDSKGTLNIYDSENGESCLTLDRSEILGIISTLNKFI